MGTSLISSCCEGRPILGVVPARYSPFGRLGASTSSWRGVEMRLPPPARVRAPHARRRAQSNDSRRKGLERLELFLQLWVLRLYGNCPFDAPNSSGLVAFDSPL